MRILGIIASSVLKKLTDTFTRSTSGSLGTSDSGNVWSNIRGTWYANGSKAQSDDAASNYSIATVDMYTKNPTINLDLNAGGGVGVAFWVSDSNNWWGVYPWQDTVTTYGQSCNSYTTVCTQYYNGNICTTYAFNYRYQTSKCIGYAIGQKCFTYGSGCNSYSQTTSYSAGSRYLRLAKSVSGTVSIESSQDITSGGSTGSIRVTVNNGTVYAQAYGTPGQLNPYGSGITTTPSSPTQATKHGLIKAPGGIDQGNTVDNITIST